MKSQIKLLKERTLNFSIKKKEPEEEEESPKKKIKKNILKYEKIKGLVSPIVSSFLKDSLQYNFKIKSPVALQHQTNTSLSKMLEVPPSDLDSFRRRNKSEHDLVSSVSSKSLKNIQKKLPSQKEHQKFNSTGGGAGYGAFFNEISRKSSFGHLKFAPGLKTMETVESIDDGGEITPSTYWQRAPEKEEEKYYDAWLGNQKSTTLSQKKQNREEFQKLKIKVRSFYEKMVGFHKKNDVKKMKSEVKNHFAVIDDDMRLKNEILFRFDEHLEREMVKELLQDKAKYS